MVWSVDVWGFLLLVSGAKLVLTTLYFCISANHSHEVPEGEEAYKCGRLQQLM
jgi:hypothetical protein